MTNYFNLQKGERNILLQTSSLPLFKLLNL